MKRNYKNQISSLIKEINKSFPNIPFGTHLALALSEYSNTDSITDKEFVFLLEKYKAERELDIQIPHSEVVEQFDDSYYNEYIEDDEDEDF